MKNFVAGVRARRFSERLVLMLGSTLEKQIWNFDVLGIREVRDLAAGAARKADIVIVSLSGRTELHNSGLAQYVALAARRGKPRTCSAF